MFSRPWVNSLTSLVLVSTGHVVQIVLAMKKKKWHPISVWSKPNAIKWTLVAVSYLPPPLNLSEVSFSHGTLHISSKTSFFFFFSFLPDAVMDSSCLQL